MSFGMPRSQTPVVSCTLALSFAHRTTAFQQLQTVGFPILTSQYGYLSSTTTLFEALFRGLYPCSIQLRTPVTRFARRRPRQTGWISLPACWLGFPEGHWDDVVRWEFHPLGNIDQFLRGFFSFLYSQGLGFISTRALRVGHYF